ncbi:SAM-dependent methyltransferase [Eubacteriales bacterium]|nr:class I SAM-dependent methyltransferase [Faecalicatena sp. BF-R-105]GKH51624.1 SAM-dependent methyltransferase [Eubacteriales bacterium]GKH64343.1 SAM-dependent methyltransferase [Eubacteriales bacterium]SFI66515.1 23S rRNA (cytosine1962-C5)-methyltransferase [Ruminococcaceae bacterium D5]
MRYSKDWSDFELLDASGGEKLERWGSVILARPDPQVIWDTPKGSEWGRVNARYHRSATGGGSWEIRSLPRPEWEVSYRELRFHIRPTGFKHTGLFPEQAVNWDFMAAKIRAAGRPVRVLNLFAYTGGATLACAAAGASVVHVDAAKGMVQWARDNAKLSGLEGAPVRWIVDDCKKFLEREIRRGSRYDGIVMDPPSYGRGPGGEVWKLEESVYELCRLAAQVLAGDALFLLLNSYTTGLSASVMEYLLAVTAGARGGKTSSSEIGLPVTANGLVLPQGSTAIWER